MAQRRFHYEQAFEHFLRANGIPYVAVDEAKRALHGKAGIPGSKKLKSFDFVVYSESGQNLLVDVKGRKHSGKTGRSLQNWVTRDDVSCLETWSGIFGDGFEPAFAFLFWCLLCHVKANGHDVQNLADAQRFTFNVAEAFGNRRDSQQGGCKTPRAARCGGEFHGERGSFSGQFEIDGSVPNACGHADGEVVHQSEGGPTRI